MTYKNITHWNLVEESRYNTTFERSLRSKMSLGNQFYDILDLLKHKQHIFLGGRISAVQSDVMSRIAFFWSYFPARVKSIMISQIMEGI